MFHTGGCMDNFKAVYSILSCLERALDDEKADMSKCDHESLGVSATRWTNYLEMMNDCGYVKGVEIRKSVIGGTMVNCDHIKITLKGLEYLQENSTMRKIYKTVKGIEDIVPGM
jgi:ribosomal protein S2